MIYKYTRTPRDREASLQVRVEEKKPVLQVNDKEVKLTASASKSEKELARALELRERKLSVIEEASSSSKNLSRDES